MSFDYSIWPRLLLFTSILILSCSSEDEEINMPPNQGENIMITLENKGPSPCFPVIEIVNSSISSGNSISSIVWSGPNGFSSDQLTIEVQVAGIYTVEVTDQDGQSATESITIAESDILDDPPSVLIEKLGLNDELELQLEATITPAIADITTITWSTSESGPSIAVDSVGNYVVTVEDACGLSATAAIDVSEIDLCPYEGVWRTLSVNATSKTSSGGVELSSTINAILLDYELTLESPNWSTEGTYQFQIDFNNQTIVREPRTVMGSGTFMIEDNLLTFNDAFFNYDDETSSMSGMQTSVLSINDEGHMEIRSLTQEIIDDNAGIRIELESISVWERQ